MTEHATVQIHVEITAEIVAAYIACNALPVADLPGLIDTVHAAVATLSSGQPVAAPEPVAPRTPAVPVAKSITRLPDLPGGRQEVPVAAAAPRRAGDDPGGVPGEVGLAGGLPDGGAGLLGGALAAGEEHRAWARGCVGMNVPVVLPALTTVAPIGGMVTVLQGDVREVLRKLPSAYFDCVVTSPPYWGLRDYGVAGQIGLERTLGEHIAVLVEIFREIRRVLKAHGTVWLNYGDCYAAAPNGKSAAAYKADGSDDRTFRDKPFSTVGPILQPDTRGPQRIGAKEAYRGDSGFTVRPGGYLKPKDLCMIPNRLAIALQDDGWWVRSEIIWNKTNPKPESIADRPAAVHEKIWLLAKSEDYFFNSEALKEPVTGGAHARRKDKQYKPAKGTTVGQNRVGTWVETYVPELRNGRNVWTFNIEGCRDAHFATFPRELAARCMKAGVPALACSFCGHALPQPSCHGACQIVPAIPGRVLDPFGGAGTVGLVAQRLGVDATLIELNAEYVALTRKRLGLPEDPPCATS